eukprot:9814533-Prorocentrum_lima.AAC.1
MSSAEVATGTALSSEAAAGAKAEAEALAAGGVSPAGRVKGWPPTWLARSSSTCRNSGRPGPTGTGPPDPNRP